jgi:hypothetical protein
MVEVQLIRLKPSAAVDTWHSTQLSKQLQVCVLPNAHAGNFRVPISRVIGGIRGSLIPKANHLASIERSFKSMMD